MKLVLRMMRLCFSHSFVLQMLMHMRLSKAIFLDSCPEKPMWNLRGKDLCGAENQYMCLFDTNARKFRELCKDHPEFHRPGNIFVISGNLRYFAGRACYNNRYQPHKWWTNGSSECQYLKSTCNEEGQVPYDNGTISRDRKCRCDYTNYYASVSNTSDKCYCNPIEEDCSCYRKHCDADKVLTPDYDCVSIHKWTGRFNCPEYKAPRIEFVPGQTTICPLIKRDFPGTMQQTSARIIHTAIAGVIVVCGVISIAYAIIRKTMQKDMEEKLEVINEQVVMLNTRFDAHQSKSHPEEDDVIPKNIRDKHEKEIHEWEQDQQTFLQTRATRHLLTSLLSHVCIVVTGESGCGKSSNIHLAALHLRDNFGYEIIPVFTGPSDIINYNIKNKKQVFIVDDICGKKFINKQALKMWRDYSENLDNIFAVGNRNVVDESNSDLSRDKIMLITCRPNIYQNSQFQLITLFTKKECDLSSDGLCLELKERFLMFRKYFHEKITDDLEQILKPVCIFPLLCKLSTKKTFNEVKHLFDAPLDSIKDRLTEIVKQNKAECFALVLCVLFENGFNTDWITSAPTEKENKLEGIFKELSVNRESLVLNEGFKNLNGTYLKRTQNHYRIIHDAIYEITAVICGQNFSALFIRYAPMMLIRDYFIFESIKDAPTDNEFINVPTDKEDQYFERLFGDLREHVVTSTFQNKQLKYACFITKLIHFFRGSKDAESILKTFDTPSLKVMRDDKSNCLTFFTTPLVESASGGYIDLVDFLVKDVKCNVNNKDGRGRTPLYGVSEVGKTDVVELLLNQNADVNQCDFKRNFPLHMACEGGHTDTVKLLLDKDAKVSIFNSRGISPLYVACKGGHSDIVDMLLVKDVHASLFNSIGWHPLFAACEGGHTKTAAILLEHSADVSECNSYGDSSLHVACRGGHKKTVELLLQKMADVFHLNGKGDSPLHVACKRGHTEIAQVLLEHGADVCRCNSFGDSPMHLACQGGYIDTVKLLLKSSANIYQCNTHQDSPFHVACEEGHVEIVSLFLEENADIFQCNSYGNTPFFAACHNGHKEIVNILLKKHADLFHCNMFGDSALHAACQNGHTETVKILLENGADISLCNSYGESPLHVACEEGYTDTVKELLIEIPDTSICNSDGDSPLHLACEKGHTDIVKLLLDDNADVTLCNSYGDTAFGVALNKGHTDIVKLLQPYG